MDVALANQYEALYESSDSPPDVFAFLEQHPAASVQDKLAVVLSDQQRRWKTRRSACRATHDC